MATPAQIEANRRNAQYSTGPRTADGKAASRLNALRHGLRAEDAVIPGEDQSEFEAFAAAMLAELRPAGMLQGHLAERIVHLQWKLRRVPRLERRAVERLIQDNDDPDTQDDAIAVMEADLCPLIRMGQRSNLGQLQVYEQRLERSARACLRELRELRKEAAEREEMDVEEQTQSDHARAEVADGTLEQEEESGGGSVRSKNVVAACGFAAHPPRSVRNRKRTAGVLERPGELTHDQESATSVAALAPRQDDLPNEANSVASVDAAGASTTAMPPGDAVEAHRGEASDAVAEEVAA